MIANALVVGFGSIGSRHARLLSELGCYTAVLSRRQVDFPMAYLDWETALRGHRPDYVVIANATDRHHEALTTLAAAGYQGRVLIEKPLFDMHRDVPSHHFSDVRIGYNLRFHPVAKKVAELLENQVLLSASAYVGQYLPTWRPGADYRKSYSARKGQGGGVLRDLSHELDYLGLYFGSWQRLSALGGHVSPLEIDSDDVYSLLYVGEKCPAVLLHMNYLDRPGQRSFTINTAEHTIQADFRAATVTCDGVLVAQYEVARDHTYKAMHLAMLGGKSGELCSLKEGIETMSLIAAAEEAAQNGTWVSR